MYLHFLGPSLVPGHIGRLFNHVVTMPSGDWDESNGFWIVADLLHIVANFRRDFVESLLAESILFENIFDKKNIFQKSRHFYYEIW